MEFVDDEEDDDSADEEEDRKPRAKEYKKRGRSHTYQEDNDDSDDGDGDDDEDRKPRATTTRQISTLGFIYNRLDCYLLRLS